MTEHFSDAAQLAAIRVAKAALEKDKALGRAEAAYHAQALDHIADRIEDAARRRRKAREDLHAANARQSDPRAVGASRSERQE